MSLTLKWFPPSWVQIKTPEATAYIDPSYMRTYYRSHPSRIEFSTWPDPIDGLPEELEPADLILLTHDHKDHAKDVTINRLRKKDTLVIGPARCRKKLGSWVSTIEPEETASCRDLSIKAVHAYNTPEGNSTKKAHHKGNGVGYLVRGSRKTIYHAGDTDIIAEMATLGKVDLALLPIGGTYTMDMDEAVEAAAVIRPELVLPMHHLRNDVQAFKIRLEKKYAIKAWVPAIGEPLRL